MKPRSDAAGRGGRLLGSFLLDCGATAFVWAALKMLGHPVWAWRTFAAAVLLLTGMRFVVASYWLAKEKQL